jgi:site-specific DNA-methyltransferase (adenine-specific)
LSTADCGYNGGWKERIPFGYDVHGSAARFFYQAKAGKRERWFYCRDCQVAHCETERKDHGHGHLNEQGKQDWSHVAAHPTVKPVQLMQYLVRLVTPPNGLILDPFGGTGTTAAAAIQEGFKIILCEQDAEYAEIIKGRIGSSCQAELDDFPLFKESDKIEPQPKPKQQEMFQ